MKTQCRLGRDAIACAEQKLGTEAGFLRFAKESAGVAIPISASLMAGAHVYDALTRRRVYEDGRPHGQAVDIIAAGRGNFAPDFGRRFWQ